MQPSSKNITVMQHVVAFR